MGPVSNFTNLTTTTIVIIKYKIKNIVFLNIKFSYRTYTADSDNMNLLTLEMWVGINNNKLKMITCLRKLIKGPPINFSFADNVHI